MRNLPLTRQALNFAAQKHAHQMRVGTPSVPYLTHLVSVALRVSPYDMSELLVVGALLHDTLEDTETTYDELERNFSPEVAALVQEVSEDKGLPWRTRKERYLERLAHARESALLVALADKIDNLEDRLRGVEVHGGTFLDRWSQPRSEHHWFFGEASAIAKARLPQHPLTGELALLHERERAMLQQL